MKKLLYIIALTATTAVMAQDNGYFFGGLESNMQWLLDDEGLRMSDTEPGFIAPEDQFRANNYFQLTCRS